MFAGNTSDLITGLFDTPNREYAATQGRWLSPDPAGLAAVDLSNPQSWNRYAYALNNPLKYTDPTGLYCQWADGTRDDEPSDGGATYEECVGDANNEGKWIDTVSITVTADRAEVGTTIENGEQVCPLIDTYFGCVKNWGNYFSVQHMVQSATNGQWGNGRLAQAALGNPVSDAIEFGQSTPDFFATGSDKGVDVGAGTAALFHPAAELALDYVGESLHDVTTVKTFYKPLNSFRGSGTLVRATKVTTYPLGAVGSAAKVGAKILEGLNVWNYGTSFVGLGMCAIGR